MTQLGSDAQTQDNESLRELTLARARAFFADVERGLRVLQTNPGASEVSS